MFISAKIFASFKNKSAMLKLLGVALLPFVFSQCASVPQLQDREFASARSCGQSTSQIIRARPLAPPKFNSKSNVWNYTFKWELTQNFATFREDPNQVMKMPLVEVPKKEIEVIEFAGLDKSILDKFVKKDTVMWPQHPNNKSSEVPYFGRPPTDKNLETRYTASRSLLSFEADTPAFSIKAGTDYPHLREWQPSKALTKDDVEGAMLRQPFINEVEKVFADDDLLITLPEILILRHRDSGEGIILRDLSRIDNDNIYVTGLSIPYVGRSIAAKNRETFEDFWSRVYGRQLGRSKARLLINYGIEMETPNSQNIMVEFTKDFVPTGKIVIRDTVDSFMYNPWVEAMRRGDLFAANQKLGYTPRNELNPFGSNSIWRFNEAGKDSFSPEGMAKLLKEHDQGWIDEARQLLGIESPEVNSIGAFGHFMSTEEGKELLRKYHAKNGLLKLKPQGSK